ncbi:MAG: tRNA (N6-threonylcarbamoyladenosine(37)-N6)-methyltransferase TrmO [Chloroflexota bacterium]|nr:MAG: tRNA (N6-threonylcarbamoyladenosine(37)-N6)-methyltransferase TrmO [Chloroflexota bacterium]
MTQIYYTPIGIIHSSFTEIAGMPIQPSGALGVQGWVEIEPKFLPALRDLDGFSHLILLYHFHRATEVTLTVTPFLDTEKHGIFATRAPKRPNPIGLSIVKLLKVEGNILRLENVDILDQTPLLDIKPYVPYFDRPEVEKVGWLEKNKDQVQGKRSDERFG